MLLFFLTLDNTLHHHIISESITYDDQLPATYAILMNSSTNNDSTMKLSPKHLNPLTVLHVRHPRWTGSHRNRRPQRTALLTVLWNLRKLRIL